MNLKIIANSQNTFTKLPNEGAGHQPHDGRVDDPRLRRHLELHVQSGGAAFFLYQLFFWCSKVPRCILFAIFKVVDYVNKKIVNTPDDKLSSVCEEVNNE